LLVEDEALIAMLTEDSLGIIGFDTVCVTTGAEALAALANTQNLAFAVIDIGLPDMRGDLLATHVRKLSPSLPIVIASGYDKSTIAQQFSADAAVTVLTKPYTEQDLKQALSSLGVVAG